MLGIQSQWLQSDGNLVGKNAGGTPVYRLNPALTKFLVAPRRRPKRHKSPANRRIHRIPDRLPAGVIDELLVAYQGGASAAELGRRYGIGKATVLRLLHGAAVPVRYPRLSDADITQVVKLYQQGVRQAEIARRVGRSPDAVWHVLNREGLVGRQ
jgi:DNA invertase Pin-like site-specific DNA recombinase